MRPTSKSLCIHFWYTNLSSLSQKNGFTMHIKKNNHKWSARVCNLLQQYQQCSSWRRQQCKVKPCSPNPCDVWTGNTSDHLHIPGKNRDFILMNLSILLMCAYYFYSPYLIPFRFGHNKDIKGWSCRNGAPWSVFFILPPAIPAAVLDHHFTDARVEVKSDVVINPQPVYNIKCKPLFEVKTEYTRRF